MNSIEINNLIFGYKKETPIIRNINLNLETNRIVALLGLNGCGKTTLIKLLAGLLKSKKQIKYFNAESNMEEYIENMSTLEKSKLFSYVPQNITSNIDFKVIDYLLFGVSNTLKFYNEPDESHKIKVEKAAIKFNIHFLLDRKMNELSGGERQIVSVCSAFVQDSPIILLDEPTSALDLKNQYLLLNILKELNRDGKMIIFSTHNPNNALFLDAFTVIIEKGEVLYYGDAKDTITVRKLKGIYGEDIKYSVDLPYKEISM